MREKTEVLVERYRDRLFSAAFSVCRNAADAEDAVQETFLRYHTSTKEFESEQHIRAWLLRVTINNAKNILRALRRHETVPLEDYAETLGFETPESKWLFEEVMALPVKYRTVLHLFYYEDFSVREIAAILHITEGTVKTRLSRARGILRNTLGEVWNDD